MGKYGVLEQGTWHPAAIWAGGKVLLTLLITKIETVRSLLRQFVQDLAKDWKPGDAFAD